MGSEKEKYTKETNFVSNLLVKTVQEIGGQTNEIWFYEKTRKEKYLIIQGFYSDSKIENLELSPEIKDINQQTVS